MKKDVRNNRLLLTNILYSGAYQVLILIVPLITTPYITRIFSVEQMGIYGASLAMANLLTFIAKMGMGFYGNRKIAKRSETLNISELFFQLLKIQMIGSIVCYICYMFFNYFLSLDFKLAAIQSIIILFSFLDVTWFFIGLEEMKRVVMRNVYAKILSTLAIFVLVKSSSDIYIYAWVVVLGITIGNLSMWYKINSYIEFENYKSRPQKKDVSGSTKLMIPHFLSNMYTTMDKQYLMFFSQSENSVGIYDQGRKIINILLTFCNATIDVVMPRLSYTSNDNNAYSQLVNKSLDICNIVSIFLTTGIFSTAKYFVPIFFGSGYEGVQIVMEISAIAFLFFPTSIFISNGIIISKGKDDIYFIINLILVVVSFLLNAMLDNRYLFVGASIAYLLAEIISFFVKIYSVKELIDVRKIILNLLKSFFFSGIFILLVNLINSTIDIKLNFLNFIINGSLTVILVVCYFVFENIKFGNKNEDNI